MNFTNMKKKCGKNYFKVPKMAEKDDATILFAATILNAATILTTPTVVRPTLPPGGNIQANPLT